MAEKLRERHGVQHTVGRHAAFPSHFDSPMHVVELPNRVGIRVDADDTSIIEGLLVPAPVKVQTPWMGVDLNGYPMHRTCFQNIDLVNRAALQLSFSIQNWSYNPRMPTAKVESPEGRSPKRFGLPSAV